MTKDETNRKIAAEALLQYEEQHPTPFESMVEGFAIAQIVRDQTRLPIDIEFLELNRGFEVQLGLPRAHILGKRLSEVFSHEATARCLPLCFRMIENGEAVAFEQYVELVKRWYEIVVSNRGSDRIELFCRDVTARKETEVWLRESEGRLRFLIERAPFSLAMFDRQMCYLVVSRRWMEDYLPGYDQVLGRSHYEVFPECPERWRDAHLRGLAGETVCGEEQLCKKKDGQIVCTRYEVRPWYTIDGSIGGIVLYTEDITEQRRTEEKLRSGEERFCRTFGCAPIGLAIADRNGCLKHCNPAFADLLGYEESDLIGQKFDLLIDSQDRKKHLAEFGKLQAGDSPFFEIENRLKHKDGRSIWVLNWVTVLGCSATIPSELMVLVLDISKRRLDQERASAEWDAIDRLQKIGDLFVRDGDVSGVLDSIIDTFIAICSADYGDLQLVNVTSGNLEIAAYRRLPTWWIDCWQHASIARGDHLSVLRGGQNVLIENVQERSDLFCEEELEKLTKIDIRDILCTPLIGRTGKLLGIFSAYCKSPHSIDDRRMMLVHLLARQAADIVERRETEAIVHDRDEHIRAILDAASDAIVSIDRSGIILSCNIATEKMFNYTREELIGKNVKILMPPAYGREHDSYLKRYQQTGVPRVIGIGREALAMRKDGSTFPVDLAVSEINHLGQFTGIIRDISERKNLQRDVLAIADEEQRRIGQDLHDSVQQELAAVGLLTQTLIKNIERRSESLSQEFADQCRELTQRISSGLKRAQREVRYISRGLVPLPLDSSGLMDALQELAVRTESVSVNCSFRCEKPVILHDSIAVTHLYRIAQEAVTNAIKHSQPRNIVIELILNTDQIELKVTDDGKGYRLENDTKGMGIKTMQYRASLIGGALTIAAKDSGGTVVSCKFFRAGVL